MEPGRAPLPPARLRAPAPRASTTAFDRMRSKTVLFGGSTGGSTYPADTWEWNGSAWSQVASAGPSGRFLHAMAYDDSKTVLFGGFDGVSTLGDTWTWNGAAWTQDS